MSRPAAVAPARVVGSATLLRRTVLPGGTRVVTEQVPGLRSVALGIWVSVGSRHEPAKLAGATHYLEHLLFKGTGRRDAATIASTLDSFGGGSNAYTSREYTCFQVRARGERLADAVDVLADMVTGSVLRDEDVERERLVVLEEIATRDDTPRDLVQDLFAEVIFAGSALGRPVLGTVDSVLALSRDAVAAHHRRHYRGPDIVVSAAGQVDHDALVDLVAGPFEVIGDPPAPTTAGVVRPPAAAPAGRIRCARRDSGQANVVLGVPGLAVADDRRWAARVLNTVLGGGMSSRLFQQVREQRGLAYSVGSLIEHYVGAGLLAAYLACPPGQVDQVVEVCRDEFDRLARDGITADELAQAVERLSASLVLSQEGTTARMSRLGRGELEGGEPSDVDDRLARLSEVTLAGVHEVAVELLSVPLSAALVGPYPADRRLEI